MFSITCEIGDSEWAKAARETSGELTGSAYDIEYSAQFRLLFGALDIRIDQTHLFGTSTSSIEVSAIDFAYQLMDVLHVWRRSGLVDEKLEFMDDNVVIQIQADRQYGLRLTTNIEPSTCLSVEPTAFVEGAEAFLQWFASEIHRRMPHVLGWRSFGRLPQYVR